MGCFSACARLTRTTRTRQKSRKPASRVSSFDRQTRQFIEAPPIVISSPDQESVERPINSLKESKLRLEGILNCSDRKKVKVDLNGDDREQIVNKMALKESPLDSNNVDRDDKKEGKKVKKEENDETPKKNQFPPRPPNYRYKNCAASDDEYEGFDLDDTSFDDDNVVVDDNKDKKGETSAEETLDSLFSISIESKAHVGSAEKGDKEVNSPMPLKSTQNGRDPVQPLLNPAENHTQWKVVRDSPNAKPPPEDQAKENLNVEHYLNRPISSPEPSFKSPIGDSRNPRPLDHREVMVETSLSSWVVESGPTPDAKSCGSASVGYSPNERAVNSVASHEDRPILGALTVEELRQISGSPTPRKISRHSPDDVPIIGSVGSYWRHTGVATGSADSGSSCKAASGRTTPSKYREDQRVIWNPTPFETRLDQALNAGVAEF